MSLHWLSERVGVSVETLELFERGALRVGAARLAGFAAILNVPPSYFFQDDPEPADIWPDADGGSDGPKTAASDFQSRAMVGIFNKIGDTESRNEIITFALAKLRDERARDPRSSLPETH